MYKFFKNITVISTINYTITNIYVSIIPSLTFMLVILYFHHIVTSHHNSNPTNKNNKGMNKRSASSIHDVDSSDVAPKATKISEVSDNVAYAEESSDMASKADSSPTKLSKFQSKFANKAASSPKKQPVATVFFYDDCIMAVSFVYLFDFKEFLKQEGQWSPTNPLKNRYGPVSWKKKDAFSA